MMFRRVAVACLCITVFSGPAQADDDNGLPDKSYLWDGGAVPFIWVALGARFALDHYTTPRDAPLMFSANEGGAPSPSWQVPGWTVSATGGLLAGAMIIGGNRSRWYHVKGLAQSLATGCVLTSALKVSFGRHRPDWDPSTDLAGDRRSFPSGHSTQAFAIATYSVAYLNVHVFDDPWSPQAIAADVVLYGAATAVAAERVIHNQHHLSDVAAGALLGSATALGFFIYQEKRFRNRDRRETEPLFSPMVGDGTYGLQLDMKW